MSEMKMLLSETRPQQILQHVIDEQIPAIMSYLSKKKWHLVKVIPVHLDNEKLKFKIIPREKPIPINIREFQQVGISFKSEQGKVVMGSMIVALEPSPEKKCGGIVVCEIPESFEFINKRSCFRVKVPETMEVTASIWHRHHDGTKTGSRIWKGRIIDISASGLQVALDARFGQEFKKGQFLRLSFTPFEGEEPMEINTQIRDILPTADEQFACLGLQTIGLETSESGRETLSRLVKTVDKYDRMNHSR